MRKGFKNFHEPQSVEDGLKLSWRLFFFWGGWVLERGWYMVWISVDCLEHAIDRSVKGLNVSYPILHYNVCLLSKAEECRLSVFKVTITTLSCASRRQFLRSAP